jgi:hypothetical protein
MDQVSSRQAVVDTTSKVVAATTDPRHRKAEGVTIDTNNKPPKGVEDIINDLDATTVTPWPDPGVFSVLIVIPD